MTTLRPTSGFIVLAGLIAASSSLMAQTLRVDIGRTGQALLESGWQEWNTDGDSFNTTGESTTFTYAETTGGTLGVSLNTTTNAGARNYGLDGVSDPGNLSVPNVWSDLFFFNNNTGGSLTLTLDNLKAGTYEITTYHFADELSDGFNNDLGIADISVNTVDIGLNATMVGTFNGFEPKTAAEVEASLATFQFTVANDGDTVDILFDGLAANGGGDSFGLNGFELWPTDGGGGGGNNFSDWIAGFNVGGLNGIGDDADGDGIDNGVENYFGTAPDTFSQGLIPGTVDTGANTFTFTHPLNATPADDLTAIYRWSTDLQTFYDDGDPNGAGTTTVNFAQGTPSGGMVTVTATLSGTVIPDKLFVAVAVTQNP